MSGVLFVLALGGIAVLAVTFEVKAHLEGKKKLRQIAASRYRRPQLGVDNDSDWTGDVIFDWRWPS